MIRVTKISFGQLPRLVELAYENDTELFDKYHIKPMGFDDCVKSTMSLIEEVAQTKDLLYYKILWSNEPIGYFIIYDNVLYSYAIAVRFRKKNILTAWWEEIKKMMPEVFATGLYENNTRAISFLEKQGMIISERRNNIVTLLNK
jgi:ribosomal protein S18 acetylase RimI-like enzyme